MSLKFCEIVHPFSNDFVLQLNAFFICSDRFYPINESLAHSLIRIRNKFVESFAQSDQYGQLTQSYIQKTFTIFNLLLSSNIALGENSPNELPVVSSSNSITQNELIETLLNVKYLTLCHSTNTTIANYELSHYEIELVSFLVRNQRIGENMIKLLPSIDDLYQIIDHSREFYPFGVIRAYEILSMLITLPDAFERNTELKRIGINDLMAVMTAAADEDGVDEVADSMWKFINAHLGHCNVQPSHIATEQIANIISHLRNITSSYKSSSLRQTATETFSIICTYFAHTTNLELLIEFVELLLCLLRDDDVHVRNRTSEIVMELIYSNKVNLQSQSEKGRRKY